MATNIKNDDGINRHRQRKEVSFTKIAKTKLLKFVIGYLLLAIDIIFT